MPWACQTICVTACVAGRIPTRVVLVLKARPPALAPKAVRYKDILLPLVYLSVLSFALFCLPLILRICAFSFTQLLFTLNYDDHFVCR